MRMWHYKGGEGRFQPLCSDAMCRKSAQGSGPGCWMFRGQGVTQQGMAGQKPCLALYCIDHKPARSMTWEMRMQLRIGPGLNTDSKAHKTLNINHMRRELSGALYTQCNESNDSFVRSVAKRVLHGTPLFPPPFSNCSFFRRRDCADRTGT